MRLFLPTLLFLVSVLPATAGLTWESDVVAIDAEPVQDQATGVFRFTNTSESPVTITHVHASCGCTTPALDKKVYAPGESGELRAVFTFGEATGQQEKTITVTTDEPEGGSYFLKLRVNIPEFFHVHPRFVMWRQNEEATAKQITIHARHPDLARPVAAEVRDERFAVELKQDENEPDRYIVAITPTGTTAPMFTSVQVTTTAPEGRNHTIAVFATVR